MSKLTSGEKALAIIFPILIVLVAMFVTFLIWKNKQMNKHNSKQNATNQQTSEETKITPQKHNTVSQETITTIEQQKANQEINIKQYNAENKVKINLDNQPYPEINTIIKPVTPIQNPLQNTISGQNNNNKGIITETSIINANIEKKAEQEDQDTTLQQKYRKIEKNVKPLSGINPDYKDNITDETLKQSAEYQTLSYFNSKDSSFPPIDNIIKPDNLADQITNNHPKIHNSEFWVNYINKKITDQNNIKQIYDTSQELKDMETENRYEIQKILYEHRSLTDRIQLLLVIELKTNFNLSDIERQYIEEIKEALVDGALDTNNKLMVKLNEINNNDKYKAINSVVGKALIANINNLASNDFFKSDARRFLDMDRTIDNGAKYMKKKDEFGFVLVSKIHAQTINTPKISIKKILKPQANGKKIDKYFNTHISKTSSASRANKELYKSMLFAILNPNSFSKTRRVDGDLNIIKLLPKFISYQDIRMINQSFIPNKQDVVKNGLIAILLNIGDRNAGNFSYDMRNIDLEMQESHSKQTRTNCALDKYNQSTDSDREEVYNKELQEIENEFKPIEQIKSYINSKDIENIKIDPTIIRDQLYSRYSLYYRALTTMLSDQNSENYISDDEIVKYAKEFFIELRAKLTPENVAIMNEIIDEYIDVESKKETKPPRFNMTILEEFKVPQEIKK